MQIIFLFFIFSFFQVIACEISPKDDLSFATSIKETSFFSYGLNGNKNTSTFFSAFNCSKISDSNKYLMISFGPQNQELTDRIKAYDIANRYRDSGCLIQNSPFEKTQSFNDRKKYLEKKWHLIKSCMNIIVSDEGEETLNYPEKQPGCNYKVLSKNKISFNGGFCFFRPAQLSQYKIEFQMNENCLESEGLKKLNINVFDFQSVLNFYAAKDPTGDSIDLTSLSSIPLRFTISPNENILPVSDIATSGEPEFPANYFLPETHLGLPEAEVSKHGFVKLRVPLWVDNKCEEKCFDGFCQGVCDYTQPLAGSINLFDISEEKNNELDTSWFQGGIVLPRYQGEISGRKFEISDQFFKVGKTYKVLMNFNDPKFDFEDFKKEYQRKIQRNQESLGPISSSSIPTIPSIRTVETTASVPEMVRIEGINFKTKLNDSFQDLLKSFSGFFQNSFWPPFYKKVCDSMICLPDGENLMTLTQIFKVRGFNEDTKKFQIEVLNLERKSNLLETYKKTSPAMPFIFCKR